MPCADSLAYLERDILMPVLRADTGRFAGREEALWQAQRAVVRLVYHLYSRSDGGDLPRALLSPEGLVLWQPLWEALQRLGFRTPLDGFGGPGMGALSMRFPRPEVEAGFRQG